MFRFLQLIAVFLGCFNSATAQNNSEYSSPLAIPLTLAANFGELRPNHFHMGVDFKTNGKEGLTLHAIQDGFVSRIKVSTTGYGRVVYINHPNGITSVYAHCSDFSGKLKALVNETQQREQETEIEMYFTRNDVPVKKGEIIALSGNSGSSTGPHLHFELRDTKTEEALNPLKFGFDVADYTSPELKSLKIYALTEDGYYITGKSKEVRVIKGKDGYTVPRNKIELPANFCTHHGGLGIAVEAIDYLGSSANVCGLYASDLMVDSVLFFQQKLDRIRFNHSRYVNSHKDYSEYANSKRKFQKSFRTKDNPLTIYPFGHLGIIHLLPGDSAQITYKAYDVKNNESRLNFLLKSSEESRLMDKPVFSTENYFFPDSAYHFHGALIDFSVDKFTFYEPCLRKLSLKEPFQFGNSKDPIQLPIHVKMKLPTSSVQKEKYYMTCRLDRSVKVLATTIESDWLVADAKYLGVFQLSIDTLAPFISPLNFQDVDTIIGKQRMLWKVNETQTDLADYDLFINDEWHLLEYEAKGSYLFTDFRPSQRGVYLFELRVKDSCENKRTWIRPVKFD